MGKNLKNKLAPIMFTAVLVILLAGCGNSMGETETTETVLNTIQIETEAETETEMEAETQSKMNEIPEGMMYSYLTGELISEEVGTQRPYAIMLNNIEAAVPQTGISHAEIVYEALVEGGITRLLGVFQDVDDVEKIGSIRSARHYYIDFANDNEAIYVHYGQSVYAQERIESENLVTLSGLSSYGSSIFYRSSDRVAPHNVYTTGEMLANGVELLGLSRDYPSDFTSRMLFNTEDMELVDGVSAERINVPFDSEPYFIYNTEDGLYYRYQYGEAHIDDENDEQLSFKNIIVQYVEEESISSEDHQDLTLNGSGNGYYITDGKAIAITWERADDSDKTRYYDADGNQISLNPGKTFFEIVPDTETVTFE